jgi:hypothetical protein
MNEAATPVILSEAKDLYAESRGLLSNEASTPLIPSFPSRQALIAATNPVILSATKDLCCGEMKRHTQQPLRGTHLTTHPSDEATVGADLSRPPPIYRPKKVKNTSCFGMLVQRISAAALNFVDLPLLSSVHLL